MAIISCQPPAYFMIFRQSSRRRSWPRSCGGRLGNGVRNPADRFVCFVHQRFLGLVFRAFRTVRINLSSVSDLPDPAEHMKMAAIAGEFVFFGVDLTPAL